MKNGSYFNQRVAERYIGLMERAEQSRNEDERRHWLEVAEHVKAMITFHSGRKAA